MGLTDDDQENRVSPQVLRRPKCVSHSAACLQSVWVPAGSPPRSPGIPAHPRPLLLVRQLSISHNHRLRLANLGSQGLVLRQRALSLIGSHTGHCGQEIPRLLGEILERAHLCQALDPPSVAVGWGGAPLPQVPLLCGPGTWTRGLVKSLQD